LSQTDRAGLVVDGEVDAAVVVVACLDGLEQPSALRAVVKPTSTRVEVSSTETTR
jgi:hypothetical protein